MLTNISPMKINYIRYHNYRCFKDLTIKFDTTSTKNISLVMGVNGSGKTEMLFSFQWVLYGFNFKSMREKEVEKKLVLAVKSRGGICPKWVSPGFDGMPDRIVLLPGRHFGLVEVKAPGERPRPLQVSRHRLLMRLGFRVYVLDDPEQIGGILDEIQST